MTKQQAAAVLMKAVLETIEECPNGAPLGPMYLAFMQRGLSLDTFNSVINALVQMKLIRATNEMAWRIR